MKAIENAQKAVIKDVYVPKPARIKMNNKLIAEFMSAPCCATNSPQYDFSGIGIKDEVIYDNWVYLKYMKFHKSWDWLMPVVEKIESIEDKHHGYFGVHISSNSCTIQGTNFRSEKIVEPPVYFSNWVLEDKISSTYKAVVEFIKWYNQQSQTNQ